ncbi:MAG: class I SAM-dependent methyltransferase [Flavobacteriales bacterium]|nr:class I SAM-dependent methyltransferase [Crocinitomicaceae bacterium]NBX79918.1 class I SAM-dependent methyltransferase [Flavobacteriales bacterium]NCA19807.1 class I SAM-dependent methyltransferase [Crocinitomicaceae bacterium]
MSQDYFEINKKSWDARVEPHLNSEFYELEAFKAGKNSLKQIELALLGDVSGKKILHLQCHFGQDSISLSRMGANVTGVDLSPKAIDAAQELAKELETNTQFLCCNVYDLADILDEKFDIVFTSYGTIGWLPDLDKWAAIVENFLKPKGKFIFVEFHPVVWMFDDDFSKVSYNYFNSGPIIELEEGTYADKSAKLNNEYVMWNHDFGEVLKSLLTKNLRLLDFKEYDFSPYNCFAHTVKVADDVYRIQHLDNKIPMVYSLVMEKN